MSGRQNNVVHSTTAAAYRYGLRPTRSSGSVSFVFNKLKTDTKRALHKCKIDNGFCYYLRDADVID